MDSLRIKMLLDVQLCMKKTNPNITPKIITNNTDILLVFDSIRDPRDAANAIHLGIATGLGIIFTDSSISPKHYKVINILNSWIPEFRNTPVLGNFSQNESFDETINSLKKQGFGIIGTSPSSNKSFFSLKLSKGKYAIVFGTETTGLSKEKMNKLDEIVSIPMNSPTKFFTLSVVAPVFAYEILRQKKQI
ncbi:MAG: hypothetical protein NTY48_05315 [Candidatus Diapherotrites archaeon]|nr:hypothetical protein [Candidatus Diapherotrites archaeon]